MRAVAMVFVAALCCPLKSWAQSTFVWTGAVSGDWNTPGNWSPNGVPGSVTQGGNPEDVAHFNGSTRTSVTVSQSVELGAISFAYGPVYSFQLNAFLQLRHGILNLSATTQNQFTTGPGTLWFEQDGDAANSLITNNQDLDFSSTSTAGTAQIVNASTGTIYFSGSSSAASAVIYNSGKIDYSYATVPSALGSVTGGTASQILLGGQTLSIGALNYTSTYDGQILDGGFEGGTGGALTKVGSGFLQLTGANGYTGKTTIQSGLLEVDKSLASSEVLIETGAVLAGPGTVGDIVAQGGSSIAPGDVYNPSMSPPNTALTGGRLFCAASPTVQERIGNLGGSTEGTYLILTSALQKGFCPHLHFRLLSANLPLQVDQYYLLVLIYATTDYSPGNVDVDFNYFPSYHQAAGEIVVTSLNSVSAIYLHLTSLGDAIFRNGFE
ncbi:MAG: autotransporter-associated beta strand repeat-containing protein [Rudaea sp.]